MSSFRTGVPHGTPGMINPDILTDIISKTSSSNTNIQNILSADTLGTKFNSLPITTTRTSGFTQQELVTKAYVDSVVVSGSNIFTDINAFNTAVTNNAANLSNTSKTQNILSSTDSNGTKFNDKALTTTRTEFIDDQEIVTKLHSDKKSLKDSVRFRTTTFIVTLESSSGLARTISGTDSSTLGTTTVSVGDRIFVDIVTIQRRYSGIYNIISISTAANPIYVLKRTIDSNTTEKYKKGLTFFVTQGASSGKGYILTNDVVIDSGTDPIFVELSGTSGGTSGALVYKGVWNATGDTPVTSAVGIKGHYYLVTTAGSFIKDGIGNWDVGDWIVSNNSTWDKIGNNNPYLKNSKDSVRFRTTTFPITSASTNSGVGKTLTGADSNLSSLNIGDRILVDLNNRHSGIYSVTNATSPFTLTRAIDSDSVIKIKRGLTVFVSEGVFAGKGYILTNVITTIDTDTWTYKEMSGEAETKTQNITSANATGTTFNSQPINLTGNLVQTGSTSKITAGAGGITTGGDLEMGSNNIKSTGKVETTGLISAGSMTSGTGGITSAGTISAGSGSITSGSMTATGLISAGSMTAGSGSITSGSVTATGLISAGSMTAGSGSITSGSVTATGLISAGSMTAGTGSITSGSMTAGTGGITSSGTISAGSGSITSGSVTATGLISAGSMTAGSGSITSGSMTATGLISAGSMTAGSGSITSGSMTAGSGGITSSGTISAGSGSITSGSVTATGLISAGSMTAGSGSITSGSMTATGLISAGSMTAGTGGITSSGPVTLPSGSPTNDLHAVNKSYVDTVALGLNIKSSVDYKTVATLGATTYNNGSNSGVGATITSNGFSVLTVDGVNVSTNDRILVTEDQSKNGIYTVTNQGSASQAFILTRSTDLDNTDEAKKGIFTFVLKGASAASLGFVLLNDVTTIGTTIGNWSQLSSVGATTASDLSVSGGVGIFDSKLNNNILLKKLNPVGNFLTLSTSSGQNISMTFDHTKIDRTGILEAGSIKSGFGNIEQNSSDNVKITSGTGGMSSFGEFKMNSQNITNANNITATGVVTAGTLKSNTFNSSTESVGINLDNTAAGNVTFTGTTYKNKPDNLLSIDTDGKIIPMINSVKKSVRLRTTLSVPTFTASNGPGIGKTLTVATPGNLDGLLLVLNDRVLVDSSDVHAGIYRVSVGGTSYTLIRASDFDTIEESKNGSTVVVTDGTSKGKTYIVSEEPTTFDTTGKFIYKEIGAGDVTTNGASVTVNRIPVYDSTTGKSIKSSGVTIDSSSNITGVGTLATGAITTLGTLDMSSNDIINTGNINLALNKNITQSITGTGKITTGTGGISSNGELTMNGKNISGAGTIAASGTLNVDGLVTAAAGLKVSSGNIDQSGSTGKIITGDGGIEVKGNVAFDSGKNITQTNGSITQSGTGTITAGTGGITSTGPVTLPSGSPTNDLHAVSKSYVDTIASGLKIKASVDYKTVVTLGNTTYNNGSNAGVGATITSNGFSVLTVDGANVLTNDRILVTEDQSKNGIYTVTNQGSASQAFILTRSTDLDNTDEAKKGIFTFVLKGDSAASLGFILLNDITTIGTTIGTWSQMDINSLSKDSVRFRTTDFPVTAFVNAGVGKTLSGDNHTIHNAIVGDRILVDRSDLHSGIYVVTQFTNIHTYTLTRATDSDTIAKVKRGLTVFVSEGTDAGKGYILTNKILAIDTTVWTYTELFNSKLNLAGGTLLGDLNMGGKNITNASAISSSVITSNTTLNAVNLNVTGALTAAGSVTFSGHTGNPDNLLSINTSGLLIPIINSVKKSVKVRTSNISIFSTADTTKGTNKKLTNATTSSIDTIALTVNDRVLVDTSDIHAGIYMVTGVSSGASFELTRATDADSILESKIGATVSVTHGTSIGKTYIITQEVATAFDTVGNIILYKEIGLPNDDSTFKGKTSSNMFASYTGIKPPSITSTGIDNILIGKGSGLALTSGNNNISIGRDSSSALITGANNISIGTAISTNMNSNNNITIGVNSNNNAIGNDNTVIGINSQVGNTVTNNILLGNSINSSAHNQCIIGSGVVSLKVTTDNLCDLGSSSSKFKNLYLGGVSNATEFKGNKFSSTTLGTGIELLETSGGPVKLTGSGYLNSLNAIVSLSTTGTIQKSTATCDTSGNISAASLRSSVLRPATHSNSGIALEDTDAGAIQFLGQSYRGTTVNGISSFSTEGVLQKTTAKCDATGNIDATSYSIGGVAFTGVGSSEGTYTGLKIKQSNTSDTTTYSVYAVKSKKMVTLSFPAMTVKGILNDSAAVSSHVFPSTLLPDNVFRFPAFLGTSTPAYLKFVKNLNQYYLSFIPISGNWGLTGDVVIEPFTITYSSSNSDVVASGSWGLDYIDVIAPTLFSTVPTNNGKMTPTSVLSITLNESISKGTGVINFVVVGTAISATSTVAVNVSNCTVSGAILTIPSQTLVANTSYYVQINSGVIKDLAGNPYAGISSQTEWKFDSPDTLGPTVTLLSPVDGSTKVSPTSDIGITFNENVSKVTTTPGNIEIFRTGTTLAVETISVSDSKVTVLGNTVNINPSSTLLDGVAYHIKIGNNCFQDTSGNKYLGIANETDWNFTIYIANWKLHNTIVKNPYGKVAMSSNNKFQVVTSLQTAFISVSIDNGISWVVKATPAIATCCAISLLGDYLYIGTSTRIYRSTDLGLNWVNIGSCVTSAIACSSSGQVVTIGTIGQGIGRSVDNGDNFVTSVVNPNIFDVCMNDAGNKCYGVGRSGAIDTTGFYFYWTGSAFENNVIGGTALQERRSVSCNKGSGDIVTIYGYNASTSHYSLTGTIPASFSSSSIPSGSYISSSSNNDGSIHMVVTSNGKLFRSTNSGANFSEMAIAASTLSSIVLDSQGLNGLAADDTELYQYGLDITNPTAVGLVPFQTMSASTLSSLVITFSENVIKGTTGNIKIYEYISDSLFETISITGANTSITNRILTITPTGTFTPEKRYYVKIDSNAILDSSDNPFTGILNKFWEFTLGSENSSVVMTKSTTDVLKKSQTATITFTFSGDPGTTFTLSDDVTGSGASSLTNLLGSGTTRTATFTPPDSNNLKEYTLDVVAGTFTAPNSNVAATQLKISADTRLPSISSFSPNTFSTANDADLVIVFDETIVKNTTGNVVIYKNTVSWKTIPIGDSQITISGTTLTINQTTNLDDDSNYYVLIDANALKDVSGNLFSGITSSTEWTFSTTDDANLIVGAFDTKYSGTNGTDGGNFGFEYSHNNPSIIYGTGSGYDILLSKNGGETWGVSRTLDANINVENYSVYNSGQSALIANFASSSSTTDTFYNTANTGATWTNLTSTLDSAKANDNSAFGVSSENGQYILAASYNGFIYKSSDGPATLEKHNLNADTFTDAAISYNGSKQVYMNISGRVNYSSNSGSSFTTVSIALTLTHVLCMNKSSISSIDGKYFYVGGSNGLFRFVDGIGNINAVTELTSKDIRDVFVSHSGKNVAAITGTSPSRLFTSINYGVTWTEDPNVANLNKDLTGVCISKGKVTLMSLDKKIYSNFNFIKTFSVDSIVTASGQTKTITIEFSEPVLNFTLADMTFVGASGTPVLTGSGKSYTVSYTSGPSAPYTAEILAGGYTNSSSDVGPGQLIYLYAIPLVLPNLTSNTSHSPDFVASSSYSNVNAFTVFNTSLSASDSTTGTYDGSGNATSVNAFNNGSSTINGVWFKISLNQPKYFNTYTILGNWANRLPQEWTVYTSYDDINFTAVDIKSVTITNPQTFTIPQAVAKHIVFHTTKLNSGIGELSMKDIRFSFTPP
jgi:hypothetical protein